EEGDGEAPQRGRPAGASPAGSSDAAGGEGRSVLVGLQAAGAEHLAARRLDELDPAELALVARLLRGLAAAPPPRRARRTRRSPHGGHLDVHATLRAARRTGGDPVRRLHRRRRLRPRPLVALLDVSGSMAPFA